MAQYRLTYFNIRARGEIIRLIFEAAGVPYEDIRYEEFSDEWNALKASGFAPFSQLPVLEVLDGDKVVLKIHQRYAIALYLGHKFNLAGKTLEDQARVNQIMLDTEDFQLPAVNLFFVDDEKTKEELKNKFVKDQLPGFLADLERLLVSNNGGDGYFVGESLTVADLAFFCGTDMVITFANAGDKFKDYPKLSALLDRIEKHPKLAPWLARRPSSSC